MNCRSFNVSLISVALCLASGAAVAGIPISQRDALVALYISTNGAGWDNKSGWLGAADTECSWYGVTCDASDTTVTAINLASNNLQGPLPSILDQLPALEFLNLTENNLSGQLPASLGSLSALQELWLGYGGSLTGTIPSELGDLNNLTLLELDGHHLEGSIPLSIFALGNLEHLNLSDNNLTGGIPSAVSGLTSIKNLYLGWNPLGGPIPTELGSLATLERLLLSHCDLTGGIPPNLGDLSKLFFLYLDWNQLTGPVPARLGDLGLLYAFEADYNQLSGPIPTELASLDSLVFLDLSHNALTGPIPPQLAEMASLRYLRTGSNSLSGPIPGELGDLPAIRTIDLRNNRLSGPIPVGLASSTTLTAINLSGNHISGSIPGEFGNSPSLESMVLDDNRLSGPIPAGLANSATLTFITLGGNRLTGPLPEELGLMASLGVLRIDRNAIGGEIPSTWANLTMLIDGGSNFGFNGLYTPDPVFSAWLDQKQIGVESWTLSQTPPPSDFVLTGQSGVAISGGATPLGLVDAPGGMDIEVSTGATSWIASRVGSKTSDDWVVHGLEPGVPYALRARSWTWPHAVNSNMVVGDWTAPIEITLSPASSTYYVAPQGIPTNDCQSPANPCASIGDALALTSGLEKIIIAPGTYPEILSIPHSVSIIGDNADTVTIDGGGSGPIITISGGDTVHVTLKELTLANGSATDGGAVKVETGSVLTMENCVVVGNSASEGGGLFVDASASAFISDTRIDGNDASTQGGGVQSLGLVWLEDSEVVNNTADNFAGLSTFNSGSQGGLRLDRSTVRANYSPSGGAGGIAFNTQYLGVFDSAIIGNTAVLGAAGAGSADVMQITNTTISGNTGLGWQSSSGLRFYSGSGELDSCTIADQLGEGPAPALRFDTPVRMTNTIVADNDPLSCEGLFTSIGHNLEDTDTCGFDLPSDYVNRFPLLAPLADNGGPTWTHAIAPGSPAIDNGNHWTTLSTDQRGFPRRYDGDGNGVANPDIGAFEYSVGWIFSDGFESGDTSSWTSSDP